MKSLWIKFGTFCQNNSDLDSEISGRLLWFFINAPIYAIHSIGEVTSRLSLDYSTIKKYLLAFHKFEFIELRLPCQECEFQNDIKVLQENLVIVPCENCENDIPIKQDLQMYNKIGRDQISINKLLFERKYEYSAKAISEHLNKGQKLTYIITDIVKSQLYKETKGDAEYNKSLNAMWHSIWPKALRITNYPYLELSFSGDQTVVAFINPLDAFKVMLKFWALINKSEFSFDFLIGYVQLFGKEKAEDVLKTNIHHKWDLNMLSVDILFRIFSKYPKNEVPESTKQNTKMFLVLTKEIIATLSADYSNSGIEKYIHKSYENQEFDVKGYIMEADLVQYTLPAYSA
jgi:hypothetical protein